MKEVGSSDAGICTPLADLVSNCVTAFLLRMAIILCLSKMKNEYMGIFVR